MHINDASSTLLAGMLPLSEGDGGTPSSVFQGVDSPEKASKPVGSLGSLADYQLATPSFRNVRPQDWEEWQKAERWPASPKIEKHSLDQRRILFVRNARPHDRDPRDIMFEVNKALANARAHVTVRLIKMGYTEKGNLTGVMGENACAEDLFAHAHAVMAIMQKLDPEVVYMDKTEKWCKLCVHGVALDRYMAEGALDLAREAIEPMAGEQLPYVLYHDGSKERR